MKGLAQASFVEQVYCVLHQPSPIAHIMQAPTFGPSRPLAIEYAKQSACLFAAGSLVLAVFWEVCGTIFSTKNFGMNNDRVGLARSAVLLVVPIVIRAGGRLHVFMGPDDFNGHGYFYVRTSWTGLGLPTSTVEEYIMLSVLMHVYVALKRT